MDGQRQERRSHLFTVRLWQETLDTHQTEWRGKIQDVTSGEVYYFRNWEMLTTLLQTMLPTTEPETAETTPSNESL